MQLNAFGVHAEPGELHRHVLRLERLAIGRQTLGEDRRTDRLRRLPTRRRARRLGQKEKRAERRVNSLLVLRHAVRDVLRDAVETPTLRFVVTPTLRFVGHFLLLLRRREDAKQAQDVEIGDGGLAEIEDHRQDGEAGGSVADVEHGR